MVDSVDFTQADLAQLTARGIAPTEATRQLELLRHPPAAIVLDRPCTPGDGIDQLDAAELEWLAARQPEAELSGRCSTFVPASGAATRMFKELIACREAVPASGSEEARVLEAFVANLERFAFHAELERALARRGGRRTASELLAALLDPDGLDYDERPKGLLAFHDYRTEIRTPFEEHLHEAATLVRDAAGKTRLHFTVSPEHEARFHALLGRARVDLEPRLEAHFEVSFSAQKPSTDTLALDASGKPFRDAEGRLLFRPAGHGALIENLNEIAGGAADLVLIKNIDNVAHDRFKAPTFIWSRALIGALVELQEEVFALLVRLDEGLEPEALADAAQFVQRTFGREAPEGSPDSKRAWLRAHLHRPIRVCGMVPNTGEPGGGPFWVRGRDGTTAQIVESAEVNSASPEQRAVFARATHFNPVFLACGLRDHRGRRYDLPSFVDPDAVILTQKSASGRELKALERPGLWNGAMAGWITRFVEVPVTVFNPVKTVLDLLRPEHQPD